MFGSATVSQRIPTGAYVEEEDSGNDEAEVAAVALDSELTLTKRTLQWEEGTGERRTDSTEKTKTFRRIL